MKKLFLFLLLANIGVAFYFNSRTEDHFSAPPSLIHPEKIVLLPTKVACLKWKKVVAPIARLARAEISKWETGKEHVTETSQGEVTFYWVHIPSLRNTRETTKQIEQLKKLEIPYWYIQENTDNPWHNVISLAILTNNSDATALVEVLKSKGVEHAKSDEQTLEQFEFVIHNPTQQISEDIQQLTNQFPSTQLEITECNRL